MSPDPIGAKEMSQEIIARIIYPYCTAQPEISLEGYCRRVKGKVLLCPFHVDLAKEIERLLADEREKVRDALNWALGELSDRGYSENIPKHDCGYTANPEGGYCEFCDMWVKAQECLDLTAPDTDEVSFVCTHCNNAGPLSECLGKQYERITGPRCPRCDYCVQVLRKPKYTAPSSTEEKENG